MKSSEIINVSFGLRVRKFALLKFQIQKIFQSCLLLQETLPVLAKHYGFQYELVEYKWPRWLHHQTEKQRVMWGYVTKPLFFFSASFLVERTANLGIKSCSWMYFSHWTFEK